MHRNLVPLLIAAGLVLLAGGAASAQDGDPARGREVFAACASCHSLRPGRHMTGPSLAGIWGREAGTAAGFARYSDALKHSGIVWDSTTLEPWLADPQAVVPGTEMRFPGLPDASARRDLIAYLRETSESAAAPPATAGGRGEPLDLRSLEANNQVSAIELCGDTYAVTAATGEVYRFWEFNLRFKTDGSGAGPAPGQPVIIPAGMRGDRAFVVFASPAEISAFIETGC